MQSRIFVCKQIICKDYFTLNCIHSINKTSIQFYNITNLRFSKLKNLKTKFINKSTFFCVSFIKYDVKFLSMQYSKYSVCICITSS